jgi:2-dehydropantoate 2-reductase
VSESIPRIAVVGSGALGIYYGVRLGLSGASVHFLLRSDWDAVRKRGSLRIYDSESSRELSPVAIYQTTRDIGPVDLVIVSLKTTTNAALGELLPPLVGEDTVVLTLQNGLGAEDTIAAIVGNDRVMGGLAFIALNRTAPGEVRCFHHGSLVIGEFGRRPAARTEAIARWFKGAGVVVQVADNLAEARWKKLVWNIPFNGLAIAAGGIATDRICADPALSEQVRVLMKEVQSAARAQGYEIPDSFLRQQFDVTPPMGAYRPSSLVDFLAGRDVEVEAIWGEPLRRAVAAGAQVPALAQLHEKLMHLIRDRATQS